MQTNDVDERLEMRRLIDEEEIKEEDEDILSWATQITKSVSCPYLGIILSATSGIFYSIASIIVKSMVNVSPAELAVYRSMGIFLPAIPIVIWSNENLFPKGKRLILLLRSLTGTAALLLAFHAFRLMPFADVTVIAFSFPVFVAIFARLFLKEPCGLFHIITICITLFGVILVSRPPLIFESSVSDSTSDQQSSNRDVWWGSLAAFSSTLFAACMIVSVRALKGVHFSVIMMNHGFISLILSITTMLISGDLCWPQCGTERLLTVALALFSFGGQFLLTLALRFEQAGPVAVARTLDVPFAFLCQIVFFQEIPNRYSIIGAILVTVSVLLSTIRTWALAFPETSILHKVFFTFEM